MKRCFWSIDSEIDEIGCKQNDLLKDQLLEASLKHDVELCVLLNHECIDKILNAELQQVKKKSFEIQEGLQARIKILEKDVQRDCIDVDVAIIASKAFNLLCVSCMQNVLIPCHDKCLAKLKLNVVQIVLWVVDSGLFKAYDGLDLVDGLPKFKYGKDHLCSACEREKARSFLIHLNWFQIYMGLFSLSKDETPEIIKKFIAQAQLNYKAKVCKIHIDYANRVVGKDVMLLLLRLLRNNAYSLSRLPEFLWAEAVATTFFTQNQEEGIDFEEHLAPVAVLSLFRDRLLLMLLIRIFKYFSTIVKWVVKMAFFNASLKMKYYVSQPEGFIDTEFKVHVYQEYQLADLFTKALPKERFEYLVHRIVIIMAQQQHAADVHLDDLCPPNKRYDLMDANKKVDLDHVQSSSSVPWIYMAQFWHTLKEDGSKYRLRFMLDKKELTLTLDDFRQIFHLPQATANNHNSFVPPPSFSDMVPFYKHLLGFTNGGKKTQSNFRLLVLLHHCKPLSKYSPNALQQVTLMNAKRSNYRMVCGGVWDRCSSDLIPQPTESTQGTHRTPSAPRSPNPDKEVAESSALRRSTVIRLRIPERRSIRLTPPALVLTVDKVDEMILQDTLEVSLAEHKSRKEQEARENVALVDEHLASEEIEKVVDGQENIVDDSSIPRNDELNIPGTRIKPRSDKESPEVKIAKERDVELTNVVIPVNVNDEDEEITDEVYELKRREKGKIIEVTRNLPIPTPIRSPRIHTNLVSSDTEKLQELTDTPHTTSSSSSPHKKLAKMNRLLSLFKTKPTIFKRYKSFFHELQGRYGYLFAHLRSRFMPRKSFDTLADNLHDVMVETLPTMVDKHIKEQVVKQVPEQVRNQVPVYVAEGLILERQKAKEETERLIAKAILQEHGNIQAQIKTHIDNAIANVIPSQVDASVRSYMSGHILHVHPAQSQTSSVPEQQYQLYLAMKADPQLQQQDIAIWLALQMKFERNTVLQTACRTPAVRPRDQDDPHDDAHPEGENSAKRQKTSEYEAYVSGESSSGQVFQEEQAPSTSGNQEQNDDFDFWTDSYASDDDEIPSKQVSQEIMEEVSLTIDEAKLRKMADEMLRQRCTSGDEHQYHIDQMKNFLKSDIVWESRKEILVSSHPRKTTPLVHSCQRDPEAPALSLINQDLLYLKKGNSGPEKIVLSLHKFPAIIFNDDDIEERTSRWVNKCVKKFNPYARYGVEHWKNPHAKIFYIRKQKEPGKPKEEIYSNSKIVQPDYKNLNKNDIEDIYLLIMNGKVPDYADTGLLWSLSVFIRSSVIWERVHDFQLGIESYQQKVNLTAPTMTFPGIEDHEMFSIIYEPVHGIIYKNSKKEKRVMRHSEIHKFCDATLNRVLEGLKSYNNDVKYGYVQKDLTKDETEYLKLFEEEIEERLKHQRQMRRWEMYVNGRPLGSRRERPE
ncbi:hypothetical protein Tco_1401322 [Tanacetum coccineum]